MRVKYVQKQRFNHPELFAVAGSIDGGALLDNDIYCKWLSNDALRSFPAQILESCWWTHVGVWTFTDPWKDSTLDLAESRTLLHCCIHFAYFISYTNYIFNKRVTWAQGRPHHGTDGSHGPRKQIDRGGRKATSPIPWTTPCRNQDRRQWTKREP